MPKKTKKKAKTYRSPLMASIHEAAAGLHKVGLMDEHTMRNFDKECLTPVRPFSGGQIRALRARERASQTVFANYLNVTKGLVSQWEREERKPAGASLKLLALVDKNGLGAIA
jgi:putative transcriptional regulator